MKLGKRYLACIVLAIVMVFSLGLFVACNETGNNKGNSSSVTTSTQKKDTPAELLGDYYCEDNDGYTLTFGANMSVTLNLTGAQQAKFTFNESAKKATWTYAGKEAVATMLSADGNKLSLSYDGTNYTFWKNLNYTVTYMVDGEVYDSSEALNGKPAAKPNDPNKGGYAFVGWYKEASGENYYAFDTEVVTANITLYAKFVKMLETEFKVEFDLAYEGAPEMDSMTTAAHKLYNLPTPKREGYTFVGWWMSHFNDGDRLTAEYVDQEIKQTAVLFAVWDEEGTTGLHVSMDENGAKWNSLGPNTNYTVTFTRPSGAQETTTGPQNSVNYSLANDVAGIYIVTVEANGRSFTVYYNNKALDAVSLFSVDESGTVLYWNAIDNAVDYEITFKCADIQHRHEDVSTNGATSFNFANCDMPENGFEFTIKAIASGYSTSESELFVYDAALATPTSLAVNDGSMLTWDAVKNAKYYEVKVGEDLYIVLDNSFSLENYSGALNITVTAKARVFAPSVAATLSYTRVKFATPKNLTVDGQKVVWDAISGATYVVTVDGVEYTVNTNEFEVLASYLAADKALHTLTVQAKGADDASLSLPSMALNLTANTVAPLTYENGKLYWAMVLGATGYVVKVNDGPEMTFDANAYYAVIELTQEGENSIKVAYAGSPVWVELKVQAIALTLDLNSGLNTKLDPEVKYYAKGTLLDLAELTAQVAKSSYSFAGWYNRANGYTNNGAKYNEDVPLLLNSNMTLYGYWLGDERVITLHLEDGVTLVDYEGTTVNVNIGSYYTLPVATTEGKYFRGWYTEPDGRGTQITNENGNSRNRYTYYLDMTFYPFFQDYLTYRLISGGTAYSVAKGDAIGYIENIVIPDEYNGLPVTTIEANGFQSCTKMLSFSMPDTITNVESTAFTSCTNLAEITVYSTGKTDSPKYYSWQGVLFKNDNLTGLKEVAFVPTAKTGDYDIPYGVQSIPMEAFKSSKLTSLTIPASVIYIGKNAFYNTSTTAGLTSITFLAQPNGEDELPLTLDAGAFNYCRLITSLELPARMSLLKDEGRWFYDVLYLTTSTKTYTPLESLAIVGNPAKDESGNDIVTYTSENNAIYKDNGRTLVYYLYTQGGTFTTRTGVNRIEEYAFAGNTNVENVVISGQVSTVAKYAFSGCTGILTLEFLGEEYDADLVIEQEAFYGLTKLESLVLPANLKKIEKNGFGNTQKLVKVDAVFDGRVVDGSGNVLIDEMAFATKQTTATAVKTTYITTLYLGKEVPLLDINAIFGGRKLVSLTVHPDNPNYGMIDDENSADVLYGKDPVTGEYVNIAFYPATKAGAYVVPEGIKTIGASVFNDKDLLTKITIAYTVTYIGEEAFYMCDGLTEVIFQETPADKEPEDLVIADAVFRSCTNLIEISFPERTVELGDVVFNGDNKLVTINLPTTLKTLVPTTTGSGDTATTTLETFFTSLSGQLANINVAEGSKYFTSVDGVLYSLREEGEGEDVKYVPDALITCPIMNGGVNGYIVIPNTVTRIWDKAFYYNKLVKSITFEDGMEAERFELGTYAFYMASNLEELELPYGMSQLKKWTTYGCSALKELLIPQTVEFIDYQYVFYNCKAIERIIFLDDTEREENKAVDLVIADGKAEYYSSEGTYYYGVFIELAGLKEVVFPKRGYKAYEPTGSEQEGEMPEHGEKATITIGSYAFYGGADSYDYSTTTQPDRLLNLERVVLTDNVISLGNYSFYKTKLTNLEIPDSVRTFGTYVFAYSTGIKEFDIPYGMTETPADMFYQSALERVTIPATITKISSYTFGYCKQLSEVIFEKDEVPGEEEGEVTYTTALTDIGTNAFYYTEKLRSIDLPDTVRTIESSAFYYSGIQSITFPRSIETIAAAFNYCTSLTEIIFEGDEENPSNLKSIAASAFRDVPVAEIRFPVSNNTIELGATVFGTGPNLTYIYISENVTAFGNSFTGLVSLEKMEVSENHEFFTADPVLPIIYNKAGDAIRFIYGNLGDDFSLFNAEDEDGNPYSTLTEIGERAFENQTTLKSIVIPASITRIANYAFAGCTNLASVTFEPGALNVIGEYAFQNCTALREIEIPASLDYLYSVRADNYAYGYSFYNCTNLETVTFAKGSQIKIIGNYTFYGCKSLKNFEIPSTVYRIDGYAFYGCSSLTEITLPENFGVNGYTDGEPNLVTLGSYMFQGCTSLETIHFPTTPRFTSIPAGMFYNCSSLKYSSFGKNGKVTAFTLPASVTALGDSAFRGCMSLSEFNFGDAQVKTIGTYVFYQANIDKLELPDSVESVGNYSFSYGNFGEISLGEGLKTIGQYAFQYTKAPSIEIPSGVTTIQASTFRYSNIPEIIFNEGLTTFSGTYAFANSGVVKVVLPDSLTTMSNYAFYQCLSLKEVRLPAGLTNTGLGTNAFDGCTELETVTIPSSASFNTFGNYTFRNTKLRYTREEVAEEEQEEGKEGQLVDFEIPSHITTINTYAFSNAGLVNLVVPNTVTTIGTYAFASNLELLKVDYQTTAVANYMFNGCSNLIAAKLPNNLNITSYTTGTYFFQNCTSLKYSEYEDEDNYKLFVLPNQMTAYPNAFLRGTGITEITIPASIQVTSATTGTYMFTDCKNLKKVTIPSTWAALPNYAFQNSGVEEVIFESVGEGANAKSDLAILGSYAFQNCVNLTELSFPKGLTTINTYAFDGCTNLQSVTFADPDSITTLGGYAFRNCASLESIVMPKSLSPTNATIANNYIFQGCKSLQSVTFNPDTNMELMPNYMFDGCESLQSVYIPASVTKIGDYVFNGCKSLMSVEFAASDKLTSVGTQAFYGCASLSSITLPDTLTTINANAFDGAGLGSLSIPSNLETLGNYAFNNNANLASVVINSNALTVIPAYAFANTPALEKVELPSSIERIEEYAFAYSGLLEFYVAPGVTYIASNAFAGDEALVNFTVSDGNEYYAFNDGLLLDTNGLIISYFSSKVPENGTLTITADMAFAPKAFDGNKSIKTIIFADDMTSIPEYALYGAAAVTKVVVAPTITTIGAYAFANCTSLKTIEIPNSVTTLGTKTYDEEGNVTAYEGYVFANTTALTSFAFNETITEVAPHTFDGSGITSMVLPANITTLCDYAFFNARNMTSFKFGENVSSVGKWAFTQCLALTELEVTGKDMVIADYAFANVTSSTSTTDTYEPMVNLKTLTLGEGVKSVGIAAFRGTGIETLYVGPTVEVLDNYAFYRNTGIKTVVFDDDAVISRIGSYAFAYSTLESIDLPESLEYLGATPTYNATTGAISSMSSYTFYHCESLTHVTFPTSMTAIGTYAFAYCLAIEEAEIGQAEFYGNYIFGYCDSLKTFNVKEGTTLLPGYIFYNDGALEEVNLPDTLLEIGTYAFRDCLNLKELYIPASVEKVNNYAFYDLTEDTVVYFVNISGPGSAWGTSWNGTSSATFVFNAQPKQA